MRLSQEVSLSPSSHSLAALSRSRAAWVQSVDVLGSSARRGTGSHLARPARPGQDEDMRASRLTLTLLLGLAAASCRATGAGSLDWRTAAASSSIVVGTVRVAPGAL